MNILSIAGCLIIGMAILLIGIVIIRVAKTKSAKAAKENPNNVVKVKFTPVSIYRSAKSLYVSGLIVSLLAVVLLISLFPISVTARNHGMTEESFSTMPITSVIHSIANSPSQDSIDVDNVAGGTIIMYYKFGCEDCEAVYKDLKAAVENVNDVYWISTQTENGKALLEKYPVTEVPSGIYVRNNTLSGNVTFSKFVLYTVDENGNTVLNTDEYYGIPRLLSMKENNK